MKDYQETRTTERELGQDQRITTFKVTQLVWLIFGLIEGALALRFIFKLIAVNPANSFATLLYNVTDLFLKPFASLTSAPAVGGAVLEISTIIAMIVFLLIAWALDRILNVLFYRPRGPVVTSQTVVAEHVPDPVFPPEVSTSTTRERVIVDRSNRADQPAEVETTHTQTRETR